MFKEEKSFNMAATAIGSMPFTDPFEAVDVLLSEMGNFPVWPQLPKRRFTESMYVQYTEGMPAIRVDESERKVWCDFSKDASDDIEICLAKYIDGDLDYFAISEEYAGGLYALAERLKALNRKPSFVKGQVVGPASMGLILCDQNKRPVIYDQTMREVLCSVLNMKAKWMERFLIECAPEAETLILFDEPYLVSVGSPFVSINEDDVSDLLDRCTDGLKGYTGVHFCGNTDWRTVLNVDIDVISFNAYEYLDRFLLYKTEISSFLKSGGAIAWGIVPNNESVFTNTVEDISNRLMRAFEELEDCGIESDLLFSNGFLTPSCGLGSASEIVAKASCKMVSDVSAHIGKAIKK